MHTCCCTAFLTNCQNFPVKNTFTVHGNRTNRIFINIKSLYGLGTLQLFQSLLSQGDRIARHQGHLFFNHICLREQVLPRSLEFKSPINTVAGKKLTRNFGFRFLKLRINKSHHWIRISVKTIKRIKTKLQKTLSQCDYEMVLDWSNLNVKKLSIQLKSHYRSKINKLLEYTRNNKTCKKYTNQQKNWVINLSKHELTNAEENVLRYGLNFAVTPIIVPKLDIISAVEKGIQRLPKSSANIIRSKVVNTLNTYKTPKFNLSSEDYKALKGLSKRDNLVYNTSR